jgi:hypothetical protein
MWRSVARARQLQQRPPLPLLARLHATTAATAKDSSSGSSSDAASAAVTGAGDVGPCPLLEAERLFPTCLEFDLPSPVAGHCLGLRLPR